MSRTLSELAQEALDVQNACNIAGVARSFAKAVSDLTEHTSGTDEWNRHPITRAWVSKMADMAGIEHDGEWRTLTDELDHILMPVKS